MSKYDPNADRTFLCPGDIEREHLYGNCLFFMFIVLFWIATGYPPFGDGK